MSDLSGIKFTEPWFPIAKPQSQPLVAELQREISSEHLLFGQTAVAVARRRDRDDVLFRYGHSPERYAMVHLTFSGRREISGKWQTATIFDSFADFLKKMRQDSVDYDTSA